MSTATLALIVALCTAHNTPHKENVPYGLLTCISGAKSCVNYHAKKGKKSAERTHTCVEEAMDDAACAWATSNGWRKKQTSNYPWSKELW